jgi:hypothetical protein
MIGEFDLFGVFLPPLLVLAPVALVISAVVRGVLRWVGAYRLVWHRPLFDLALFVIVLGSVAAMSAHWGIAAPPFFR